MKKLTFQLPAVVRQALKDAVSWFEQVPLPYSLDLLKIEKSDREDGSVRVTLTFERGLRFDVNYYVLDGDFYRSYHPTLVTVWKRKRMGADGEPSEWQLWRWLDGEDGLTEIG